MKKKLALIIGIAGQDGSYLAELLISKKYNVFGIVSKNQYENNENLWRLKNVIDKIFLLKCDLLSYKEIENLIKKINFDEIYNLASSHDPNNFESDNDYSFDINLKCTLNFLRAIANNNNSIKFFNAGSSLIFGEVSECPQNESTFMNPNTFYGIAKLAGLHFVRLYREKHKIYSCTGILYNHESPRRDPKYISRKISMGAAKIKLNLQKELILGDIYIQKDWSSAEDVVFSIWSMLQLPTPEDFVIGSGILYSIQDMLDIAFSHVDLNWSDHVKFDKKFFRDKEYLNIYADSSKAINKSLWAPKKDFKTMIIEMVDYDLELLIHNKNNKNMI